MTGLLHQLPQQLPQQLAPAVAWLGDPQSSPLALASLFLVGALASALNAVAGGGSLLVFPLLVALGVPELSANATGAAALWPGSLSSALGFLPQLRRTGAFLRVLLVPTILGSLLGAFLLVRTSAQAFRLAVPVLVGVATLLLALQPLLKRRAVASGRQMPAWLGALLHFVICIYGGYFGAGMGILMLAVMGLCIDGDLHELNALKAWLALLVNVLAMGAFVLQGLVVLVPALVLAAGAISGGYLMARLAPRLHADKLRRAVVVFGLILTVWFAQRAWAG